MLEFFESFLCCLPRGVAGSNELERSRGDLSRDGSRGGRDGVVEAGREGIDGAAEVFEEITWVSVYNENKESA